MDHASQNLPAGTVTFLFSDIEGSTELVDRLDPQVFREILEQHNRLLRGIFAAHGGVDRGTHGDAFLVVFRDAPAAVSAAVEAQRALAGAAWPQGLEIKVRMGIHTGQGVLGGDDYVGVDINRAARIGAAAHGGQVLLSEATRVLAERSLPVGVDLRSVGLHRFKGLERPERLSQVTIDGLRADFPPVRSLTRNLSGAPSRTTTFLGRDREVDELHKLLRANRLVTLVGPGGTGKTRLAVEVGERAADRFVDGAVFVPLDSVAEPHLVGSAIVAGLGLRDTSGRGAREQLLDNLPGREILLVLDNFEHVLAGVSLVGELLAAAPTLSIVATSRAPLRLAGEQVFPVPPLPMPVANDRVDLASLESVESVRLFVDRGRRVQPSFALNGDNAASVSAICQLVDGLPLGIEIAAARIALLGPAGIRERLARKLDLPGRSVRDAPARQRTLREAISWSHDLLDEPSQRLLRQLSVFAGGCRLEELEFVCQPSELAGADVVDTLASLVDHSLVIASQRPNGVRYEMLGTIRDFALEREADDPERDDVEHRHALTYLAFAEANGPRLETREQTPAFRLIAMERDNLRAALRWAIDHTNPEVGMRLAAALARFWLLAGEMSEGRSWIEAALDIPGSEAPTTWRMRALEGAGLIYYYAADNDRASKVYRAQLELARQLGDRRGETDARYNLLYTESWKGRLAETLATIDEIGESYRALGDDRFVARTITARANLMMMDGRLAEAQRLLLDVVTRYRALGDLPSEMAASSALALGGLLFGDRSTAARWFPPTFALARELGDTSAITVGLPVFAAAALEFVGPSEATTLLGAYDGMCRRYGTQMPRNMEQAFAPLATRERAKGALSAAAFESALEAGQAMSIDDVFAYLEDVVPRIGSEADDPGVT
jgi:predicted ATPase/class 3 adenylate cyclase